MGSIYTYCVLAVRTSILILILRRLLFLQEIPRHLALTIAQNACSFARMASLAERNIEC